MPAGKLVYTMIFSSRIRGPCARGYSGDMPAQHSVTDSADSPRFKTWPTHCYHCDNSTHVSAAANSIYINDPASIHLLLLLTQVSAATVTANQCPLPAAAGMAPAAVAALGNPCWLNDIVPGRMATKEAAVYTREQWQSSQH